ncbi:MAG: BREX-1 system adenine-specific DNA-methyltransferase PglX [Eubacterium sp.]|nr:BREX-1 system adenine-specific DNA-methyltransferase PglX [Eubacterium sp.]
MNKTAIKNFSVWAREKLIDDIKNAAMQKGISTEGIAKPLAGSSLDMQLFDIGLKDNVILRGKEITQRNDLAEAIRRKAVGSGYETAFNAVMEEIAYTWFNRLIAIRFMEVNDYLPSRVRVISSEISAKAEPDLVTSPFDSDLDFTEEEQDKILDMRDKNDLKGLFNLLFIKQCNKLHEVLPRLFEKTNDYTELLLNIDFTDKDGIIYHLVHDINEDDWRDQVQIIGWLYQYYISDKHNQIVNIYKGTIKKEDIPAATQLFTTDWVVRYMVDNSLGRYWIERNPESRLADKLAFFVKPKNGKINYIDEDITPQELTFLDEAVARLIQSIHSIC